MRELTNPELLSISGATTEREEGAIRTGVSYVQLAAAVTKGTAIGTAVSAFQVGYWGATALGAGDLGKSLGSWAYDFFYS